MSCNKENRLLVNELFSGIGSQRQALERLHINYKIIGISEIDEPAIKSYEAIYGSARNYGDISKVEKLDYADFWTYSSPCQDFSICGKQQGAIKGKTRSGLLYEVERLLNVAKEYNELPKYLMLENVKNLVGKKFKPCFDDWVQRLDNLGYNTYWSILNAKDYGIPQNRERVFAISIRKDVDTGKFHFPMKQKLDSSLKDLLEDNVDENFYLSRDKINRIIRWKATQRPFQRILGKDSISPTLTARGAGEEHSGMILLSQELNSTTCMEKQNENGVYEYDYSKENIYTEEPTVIIGSTQKHSYVGNLDYSPTLTSAMGMGGGHVPMITYVNNSNETNINNFEQNTKKIKIRKLTPLECWRLMGQSDENFYKAKNSGISNTQLYKQSGNSIVVDVLEAIFEELCKAQNIQYLKND